MSEIKKFTKTDYGSVTVEFSDGKKCEIAFSIFEHIDSLQTEVERLRKKVNNWEEKYAIVLPYVQKYDDLKSEVERLREKIERNLPKLIGRLPESTQALLKGTKEYRELLNKEK